MALAYLFSRQAINSSEQKWATSYNLKHIAFYNYTLCPELFLLIWNRQVYYNVSLPEIPSCPSPQWSRWICTFPLLNTSYMISSKSHPTASSEITNCNAVGNLKPANNWQNTIGAHAVIKYQTIWFRREASYAGQQTLWKLQEYESGLARNGYVEERIENDLTYFWRSTLWNPHVRRNRVSSLYSY